MEPNPIHKTALAIDALSESLWKLTETANDNEPIYMLEIYYFDIEEIEPFFQQCCDRQFFKICQALKNIQIKRN